jgi:serine protease Do
VTYRPEQRKEFVVQTRQISQVSVRAAVPFKAPRLLMALMIGAALLIAQAPQVDARGAPESFADLAEQFSPAVVNITTSSLVAANTDAGPMVPEGSPFQDFFDDFMKKNGQGGNGQDQQPPQRSEALGSGFVISADGYIVTNNHVIEGADDIEIDFFNGKRLRAKLVGTDLKTDIALLKVESDAPLPFVTFGDSDVMRVGDWVVAMGNPLGQGFSVSAGIVSARKRELSGTYDDFIQTDAAINRGNSGGPLFNTDGQVVGVNTAILSPNGGSIGIGFSMASNVVSKVVGQLREFGETRRGWLGVRIQDVTPDVAEAMGLADAKGALITDVPDGPAKDAGLLAGDVITSFFGSDVADTRELVRRVADAPIGEAVPVIVQRDGKTETLSIKLGRREDAEATPVPVATPAPEAPANAEILGLTVAASEAYAKGLREGDLITEAGQQKVVLLKDLEGRVAEAKGAGRKSLLLLVRRDGDPRFVALSIE